MCECKELWWCKISNQYSCKNCEATYSEDHLQEEEYWNDDDDVYYTTLIKDIEVKVTEMTEAEDLTRLVDKLIHKSMSNVSKLSHIERELTEKYNEAIKENRLAAGKIMHELEPFFNRLSSLYPNQQDTFSRDALWDYRAEMDRKAKEIKAAQELPC